MSPADEATESMAERVARVRERIDRACGRCGRAAGDVAVVAVAKKFGPERVREAAEAGLGCFGENRVQEAAQKIPLCPGHLEWHLVGHLQGNKARYVPQLFRMVHSVDSLKLLETLNRHCGEAGLTLPVCLQVNVSGERSKFGLPPDDVPAVLEGATACRAVDVVGLMTVPPFTEDPEGARPFFVRLRERRDAWRVATGFPLEVLSMGMSHDFEVAIEEGATLVRLGTCLFGQREGAGGGQA